MWYCEYCDIEITKNKKNRHLLSGRHQKNKGENPYLNGKIYKIVCLDENDDRQYIGSTFISLEKRLQKHKNDKKEYEEGKDYSGNCASYQILHNCEIQLIEDYPCDSEVELKKREQYHINNNECINIIRSYGRKTNCEYNKKYREKHKEKLKQKRDAKKKEICKRVKEYYQKNKEKIKQYHKEYREKNKEHLKQKKKEYNQKNKEHLKQINKEYREKHKEKIKARVSKVIQCDCGLTYTHHHKQRHFRTQLHQERMKIST